MVDGIGQRFFYRLIGIVEEAFGLRLSGNFYYLLCDDDIADIAQRRTQLLMQRACECLFDDFIPGVALRELYDVNLRVGEEPLRLRAEEHQRDIFGLHILRERTDQIHIGAQLGEVHRIGSIIQ